MYANPRYLHVLTHSFPTRRSSDLIPCDVTDETSLAALFDALRDRWGTLDFLVHGIAFSDKEQLKGRYADTTRENFRRTLDISCFSFTDAARRAAEMMPDGGSLVTLTYAGAERVIPHYNVMGVAKAALEASVRYLAVDFGSRGIRVNALSAGPIKTLAASGIGDFRHILKWNEFNSPLERNTTIDEVGGSARSEEHTSELQSLMRISYAVFCVKQNTEDNGM